MAKLGSNVTNKFSISEAEVRIGPLNEAMKLTQAHSMGLLDNAAVEFTTESEDLEGGLPRVIFDTAITRQTAQVTLSAREYSRKNIEIYLGEAPAGTLTADVTSTTTDALTAASVAINVAAGDGAGFADGDLIGVYDKTKAEEISLVRVATVAADTLTLDTDTPLLFAYDGSVAGAQIIVYSLKPVSLGNLTETNYFSCTVLGKDRQGRPKGFAFWKCAISSGLNVGFSSDTFGATDGTLKVLQPALVEYSAGNPLAHLADIIPTNPLGIYFGGGDA